MASFTGTKEEFHRYIGPRLRNIVQQITKKRKSQISVCEHCGAEAELEAAHVKGLGRKDIVDRILKESTTGGIYTVDLELFEDRFKGEHQPLEKFILLLCGECHRKYDSGSTDHRRTLPSKASGDEIDARIREVKRSTHQSWSNLLKAVLSLQKKPHEPFGTPKVRASAQSVARLIMRETGLDLAALERRLTVMQN